MLRKLNLVSAALVMAVALLSVGNAMALSVFTVGGVKMICQTCTCAEMADAGVPLEHCVDTALIKPDAPKVYDKIIRYSSDDVTLHSPDGSEFPLSSDAAQRQFDEISKQGNFRQLIARLKPAAGPISQERVERLAKGLGVEIVDNQERGDAAQGGEQVVLATIRDGKVLELRSFKASERTRLSGDVYKARATGRGGKLILQFDRPLSRESKLELKIESLLGLDRETRTALGTCDAQPGTLIVENANSRNPVLAIAASHRPRNKHKLSTRYIVDACWP